MKEFILKFLSRKFILTLGVMFSALISPKLYKEAGVSDSVTLAVLALLVGIGISYGFVNVRDAALDKKQE